MKLSVIIPVYNVEKYLGKCIESIMAQTYENRNESGIAVESANKIRLLFTLQESDCRGD